MKKFSRLAIVACVIILIAASAFAAVYISDKNKIEDVFNGEDISENVDSYIISQTLEKAKKAENLVWLTQSNDVSFSDNLSAENSEKLKDTVDAISNSFFDGVIIRADYLTQKNEDTSVNSSSHKVVCGVAETLSKKEKDVYINVDFSKAENFFATVGKTENIKGIIITGVGNADITSLNERLKKIYSVIKDANTSVKVSVAFPIDYKNAEKLTLDGEHMDSVYLSLDSEKEDFKFESYAKAWDKLLTQSKMSAVYGFREDFAKDKKLKPSAILNQVYTLNDLDSLKGRAFYSFSAVEKNYQNSFSAVETYIKDGISPEIAFREINVTGYDNETVQTEAYSQKIEITGSNLFPMYINSEKLDVEKTGSITLDLSLNVGENSFKITQNSKSFNYKLNVNYSGDLVKSIVPSDKISVTPKDTITVCVVAYAKAEISVKLGTKQYKLTASGTEKEGCLTFSKNIKLPSTMAELESIGNLVVLVTANGETTRVDGAKIIPTEKKSEAETTLPQTVAAQNNVPTDWMATTNNVSTTAWQSQATENTSSYNEETAVSDNNQIQQLTGSTMCMVTSSFADTKPSGNDDTYVPYYTPLIYGTLDYVVGESEAYNYDSEEQEYYYELASGRKVLKKNVQLYSATMPDNAMSIISTVNDGGKLVITLKTNWRVPYSFSFGPQSYFSGYTTSFNVNSFTADNIQFTFYNTTSVTGTFDTASSDVVASGSWSVSPQSKTATLTMPLRYAGRYYGYSLEYDTSGNIVLTIQNRRQALSGSVVLLDAGHGGSDSGASGYGGQVREADVNLAVVYRIKALLEGKGTTVYLTRADDSTVSLEDRKAIVHSLKPDAFVSIHCNGSYSSASIGTAAYYYKPFSQPLSKSIYDNMTQTYVNTIYPGQPEIYNNTADGNRYYPFSVTRLEDCPSALIEIGYVTNDNECLKLIDPTVEDGIASAVATGIETYFLNY